MSQDGTTDPQDDTSSQDSGTQDNSAATGDGSSSDQGASTNDGDTTGAGDGSSSDTGASTADGSSGDGSSTAGSAGDGSSGDGSSGDGSTSDASTGDGSSGDSSTGDGSTGDGSTGDGSSGDGSSGDGSGDGASSGQSGTGGDSTSDGSSGTTANSGTSSSAGTGQSAGNEGAPTTSAVDVSATGDVMPIQQPSSMACWATVATMMYSWKKSMSYTIDGTVSAAGPKYAQIYKQNTGLGGSDKAGFLSALSMVSEPPQDYSVTGWANLIKQYGPLWVTTNEAPTGLFSVHARIVTALKGDGSVDGTSFTIVDPGDGAVHTETVTQFVNKYDSVATGDMKGGGNFRPQVVHF